MVHNVGAVHGECHTLFTLMTMLCISKEKRIGWLKVLNAPFNDSAKVMLENLLENLFGKNYDMENKVLLFNQMSVLRQLR
jgi:hypothetical protein